MWPLNLFSRFSRPTLVVRLGASELQLWSRHANVLALVKAISCTDIRGGQWDTLNNSLKKLLAEINPGSAIDVIVDTKWMPMSLLSVGVRPLNRQTLDALAHHRFSDIFGDHTKTWQVQVDHLPGEAHGLAFACPQELMDAIQHAVGEQTEGQNRSKLNSIQSTFYWVSNSCITGREKAPSSCVVVREQDRSIFAFLRRGQIVGLYPMGPMIDHRPIDLAKEADILAMRCALVFDELPIRALSIEAMADSIYSESSWTILQHEEVAT